jgi:hypothetical protein
MPSAAWARLLRLVPTKDQDGLMLLTSNRTEFAIQAILRFDPDFLIIKGRLAGSQDQGRVFFIPYEQIDHVGFYRSVKDAEFNEMFADLEESVAASEESVAASEAPAAETNGSKTPMKSAVLERFRSRSAASIATSPLAPRSSPSLPDADKEE